MLKWAWISIIVILLDQLTKFYISDSLSLCRPGGCEHIVLLPFFKFTLLHNTGAAFSFLSEAGGWQRWGLTILSSGVSAALLVWLYRLTKDERLLAVALALILGGAIGNLIDRVSLGYVVDFVVLHYDRFYFPAFNVADASISVGGALLVLDLILSARRGTGRDRQDNNGRQREKVG